MILNQNQRVFDKIEKINNTISDIDFSLLNSYINSLIETQPKFEDEINLNNYKIDMLLEKTDRLID